MILLKGHKIGDIYCLIPTDEESEVALKKVNGKTLSVKTETARSPNQHRMYFGIMRVVFDNQELFPSLDNLKDETMIAIGYSEPRTKLDGTKYLVAESIAFHNCKAEKFRDVFDRSIEFWCKMFGHDPDILKNQAPIERQYHG